MQTRKIVLALAVIFSLFLGGAFAYHHWYSRDSLAVRAEMLSLLPSEASAVVLIDLAQFRSSPFLAQFFAWAPRSAQDEEYAEFVRATGFNYERDLDRVAVATSRQSPNDRLFVIAEGHFDRARIEAYAARSGTRIDHNGTAVFSIHFNAPGRVSFLTFLRDNRIAWTNDTSYAALFERPRPSSASAEWREHFTRLAGTPLFAVIRQDSGVVSFLAEQAPGGLRSPQLATLLNQLQWISIGGKPDGNVLKVVIDGECISEGTSRQLSDFLGGILVLAQIGLNEPKTRKQLDPQLREACLELLRSADVQKMDRGTSKSVRVVFDVTPKFLETARTASNSVAPPPSPATK